MSKKSNKMAQSARRTPSLSVDPFEDVQLEKVLKQLSFIRIELDKIIVSETCAVNFNYYRNVYGFQIEYTFPCLEGVSKALSTTVRAPEKTYTDKMIEFKYKRVVNINMNEEQVKRWQKEKITIYLLFQYVRCGVNMTKPLAKCTVPLYELLIAPYLIYKDFQFIGEDFVASALIRIELGSHLKPIMNKLNELRGERREEVVEARQPRLVRSLSKSSSRCPLDSHRAEVENIRPARHSPAVSTSTPILTDPNMTRVRSQFSFPDIDPLVFDHNDVMARPQSAISSNSSNSARRTVRHIISDDPTMYFRKPGDGTEFNFPPGHDRPVRGVEWKPYGETKSIQLVHYGKRMYLELSVHEARGLPPVTDSVGRIVSPNAYISVLTREGEVHSEPILNSRTPVWNWTARFSVSSERRNIIIKVIHRGVEKDIPLGIVSINMPVCLTRRAIFEITDLSGMGKHTREMPQILLSMSMLDVDDEEDSECSRGESARTITPIPPRVSPEDITPYLKYPYESPRILESSEVIYDRLKKNMEELEIMEKNIKR